MLDSTAKHYKYYLLAGSAMLAIVGICLGLFVVSLPYGRAYHNILVALESFIFFYVFKLYWAYRRRCVNRIALSEVLEKEEIILYLRPFYLDMGDRPYIESTVEMDLARIFGSAFIAIGKPDESLPELGADRISLSENEWKSKVLELASRASLILLRPGTSGGIFWELEQLAALGLADRLIIFFSYHEGDINQYSNFVSSLYYKTSIKLPEPDGSFQFISFDNGVVPFVDRRFSPLYNLSFDNRYNRFRAIWLVLLKRIPGCNITAIFRILMQDNSALVLASELSIHLTRKGRPKIVVNSDATDYLVYFFVLPGFIVFTLSIIGWTAYLTFSAMNFLFKHL